MSANLPERKQKNTYVLVMVLVLAIIIAIGLERIFSAFLGATIIYVVFRPLNIYLQEKRKWNKGLSAALIMLISFVCMIIPVFLILNMIADKVMFYVENPDIVENLLLNINKFATENLNDPKLVDNTINALKNQAAGQISSVINGSVNIFVQIIIMYFTLYFTMKYFRGFEKGLVHYSPFKTADAHRIGHELRNMTYSNIIGQGFIAIIQGTLLGIGFWIFGLNDPFFYGVLGVLLSMIPFFGTPFVFVPAGLIEISNGHIGSGIGIILYGYLLVTMIDNFIRMAIGEKLAHTHPLITVIGVVIGLSLFGILGILFGPLLLSLFIILVKIYKSNLADINKLTEETEEA